MKKAVIDIDGVLNNYPQTFIDFINDSFATDFKTLKEIKQTIPYDKYKELKEAYRMSAYKNNASPKEGAKELLEYLHSKRYLIYIITARPLFKYNLLENTILWLRACDLYYDYIYCSQKKDFTIFEKFGHIDLVIDDNCDNVNNIKRINGNDCTYINIINSDNENSFCDTNIVRTKDLSLVKKLI